MRGIVGLFVVLLIGAAGLVWMQAKMSQDPGPTILVAFGEAKDGEIEVNICIPMRMQKMEVPPEGGKPTMLPPDRLGEASLGTEERFGDQREMDSIGSSLIISDMKAGGAPDFWVKSSVKTGESYTLIYWPDVEDPKKYKFSFDAKAGMKKGQRVEFKEMK